MKKYFIDNGETVIEISLDEWLELFGAEEIREYCSKLYFKEIAETDIPADKLPEVKRIVSNREKQFGVYKPVATDAEIIQAVEGIL